MHLAREETSAEEIRSLTVEEPKTTDAAEQDGVPAGSGTDPSLTPPVGSAGAAPDISEASAVEAATVADDDASAVAEAEAGEAVEDAVAAVVEAEASAGADEADSPAAIVESDPQAAIEEADTPAAVVEADASAVADEAERPAAAVEADASDEAESRAAPDAVETEPATPAAEVEPAPATLVETPTGAQPADRPEAIAPTTSAEEPVSAEEAVVAEEASRPFAAVPVRPVDDRPEPTTMEELLNEQAGDIRSLKHGDVVEGTVVRIDKDEMLVDIGAKSEGVVSNRELYGRNTETQPELSIGDTVLVYVLQPESQEGHAVLSLRRAGLERKWRGMQEQFDEGVIIEAPVIDHNKGGLIVDCGIRGFVPISQIVDFPRRPQNDQPRDAAQEIAEKLQPYVGRKLRLKILEVNRKANRLILSEKVALYEERREKRDELFSSLQVGQKVTGTVRSIAPFGVFVDLGGIDGLVHKSELSWNKVNNPEAGYQIGEEVEAEVIDINHERGRISLSIRRLQPDPWQSTVADLKVADIVDGTVTKIVNFGAFVRVKDGLEGLIHISELSHQRVAHPGDVVHEGQTLKLKVISLDSERHRLGLSLKQAEEAPARPARERRPRPERGYDSAQAIQEPEGGIDNTLAAAFAQVRQQIAEQDAARSVETDEDGATVAEAATVEGPAAAPEASISDDDGSDGVASTSAVPDDEAVADASPTAESPSAEDEPEPEPVAAEPATAETTEAEIEAAPPAADEPEPEPVAAEPATAEPATAEIEAAPPAAGEPEPEPVAAATPAEAADEPTTPDGATTSEAPAAEAPVEESDETEKVEA
jgi:small subunit ribosomal protein S1